MICLHAASFMNWKACRGMRIWKNMQDASTERGQCMLKRICEKLGFASLGFQSLDGLLEAIGLPKEKVCTYCWNGKE